ncbi:uncharacterized protein LOC135121833 [Zophobas morio]|uniref:uncharacterized protein LOC135121833 n=1 Tax=Zophobas morio TaxID=2755281 RepID=UPI003083740F
MSFLMSLKRILTDLPIEFLYIHRLLFPDSHQTSLAFKVPHGDLLAGSGHPNILSVEVVNSYDVTIDKGTRGFSWDLFTGTRVNRVFMKYKRKFGNAQYHHHVVEEEDLDTSGNAKIIKLC